MGYQEGLLDIIQKMCSNTRSILIKENVPKGLTNWRLFFKTCIESLLICIHKATLIYKFWAIYTVQCWHSWRIFLFSNLLRQVILILRKNMLVFYQCSGSLSSPK